MSNSIESGVVSRTPFVSLLAKSRAKGVTSPSSKWRKTARAPGRLETTGLFFIGEKKSKPWLGNE